MRAPLLLLPPPAPVLAIMFMRFAGLVFVAATFLHNRTKAASGDIFLSHPPSLVPSLFEQKVLFYLLGEALFGAISLANPSWADVHPT